MCGIVGYVGDKDITSVLVVGLDRLSYRGYDSSGIAILADGELSSWKRAGKLVELKSVLDGLSVQGSLGIGTQNAAVTNSLGGASASHTVTAPTAALGGTKWYKNPLNVVDGYSFDPSNGTINLLKGGAGDGTNYGGGVVIVAARYLFGSGSIIATSAGNAGGGVLFLVSSDKSYSYTLSAAGSGTGSAGNTYFLEAD